MTSSVPAIHIAFTPFPLVLSIQSSWRDRAACREMDVEVFFPLPSDLGGTERALKICRSCPVRAYCGQHAFAHHEQYGIWGGLTESQRETMLRAGIAMEPDPAPVFLEAG